MTDGGVHCVAVCGEDAGVFGDEVVEGLGGVFGRADAVVGGDGVAVGKGGGFS